MHKKGSKIWISNRSKKKELKNNKHSGINNA